MADIVDLKTETNLFGDEIASTPDIDRETLAHGLYAQLKDITLEEFARHFITPVDAMLEYASLCVGERTGQRISLLFNPHRLDTGTKRFPISLYKALQDPRFVNGLARVILWRKKKEPLASLFYNAIGTGTQGTSYVQEFPPHVARDLALDYGLSKSSRILDPCAGWGGRMLGFSAVVNSYTACEPSSRTYAGLVKLLAFIKSFRGEFEATLYESPFEDVDLPSEQFDFAFTSPPYYDTEFYAPGESTNSFNRYASFDDWCLGFYAPLIHRTMAALKPEAAFVINIGSRLYPMNDKLMSISEGLYKVERQKDRLSTSNGLGKKGEGETFYEVRRLADTTTQRIIDALSTLAKPAIISGAPAVVTSAADAPAVAVSAPEVEQQTTAPSALAFALAQAVKPADDFPPQPTTEQTDQNAGKTSTEIPAPPAAEPPLTPAERENVAEAATAPPVVEQLSAGGLLTNPSCFLQLLTARGHRVFNRNGKLLISNSSKLTQADRQTAKMFYDELLLIAEPWENAAPNLPTEPAPPAENAVPVGLFGDASPVSSSGSLASFLGAERPTFEPNWTLYDPPDLSGIDDVVFNLETTGLKWWAGDKPIGATVGTLDGQKRWFLPFGFRGSMNHPPEKIKRWMQEQLKHKRLVGANAGFDIHMSRVFGVDLEEQGCTITDVQHHAALLDDHRKRFAIDVLAKDYLGGIEVERVDESQMANYEAHEAARRAEYQVQLTAQLHNVFKPLLDEQDLQRVRALEDATIFATVEMERNGAPMDLELLDDYHKRCTKMHDDILWEITREVGFAFDHTNSSWQRLFEHLRLPVAFLEAEDDKEPKPTFADPILKAIDHPLIQKARFASQLASLDSKTFSAYPDIIVNGILRFQLNQLRGDDRGMGKGTVSGRYSAGYIQQVPNKENHAEVFGDDLFPRRLFIAAPGYQYFAADAEQIEYRIFASHSKNERVLKAYRDDPWTNFHKFIYAIMIAYKPDMLYPHQKSLNFMTIYGGGLIKTAVMMGFISEAEGEEIRKAGTMRTDARLAQAREIQAIYNREMPEVRPLLKQAAHLAQTKCDKWCNRTPESRELHKRFKHNGFVRTVLGRRSRFPYNDRLHKALNAVIQGSAADIMKQKLVELHAERKRTGFVMRMTVHDEVCGDVPNEESAAMVSEILNRQSFPQIRVPILWAGKTGNNWAECK
jgi:DNA polymerase I-like protein with 3'-5' exonuclease and polymerase domains